jgi:hypothetical protein
VRDPFEITGHTVVANSGGKTSGYGLWRHLQANGGTLTHNGACLFNNTGWERRESLDFLAEQSRRWGVEIVVCEFTRRPATVAELASKRAKADKAAARLNRFVREPASYFARRTRSGGALFDNGPMAEQIKAEAVRKATKYALSCWESGKKAELIGVDSYRRVTLDTASTDGRPFTELLEGLEKFRREVKGLSGVLPNGVQRICTGHLKVRLAARVAADLWGIRMNAFECRLGLRADEEERVLAAREWGRDGGRAAFPLYDAGVDKEEVAAFWAGQPFRLSLKSHEGNCGGCYMKRRNALVDLIRRDFFDLSWWLDWEKRTGQRFRQERSYRGLAVGARTELHLIPPDDYDNAITCETGYCTD